jgi:aerotolerance regulator-like protein
MPFSFLNPWLWLGAFSLGVPLWLHLRRKQQANLFRFSAVRFLQDQPEPRRSPLRLEDLPLFALRSLAVLLIVAAFAWPFLKTRSTTPVQESRVYILDNTLSHQASDGFARDRDRILREIAAAGSGIQIAVVELRSNPRVVAGFGDDRQSSLEKVKSLQPAFERGSYLASFRQASALLESSLGESKKIVFLGDNQENQWNEGASTPPFLRNVQVELARAPGATLPNLSLAEPRAQRIFLGDKSLVNFTVRLAHTGEPRTANVLLKVNGQAIVNREVDLEGQPPTILLRAQWEADPSAWLRGEAAVEGLPDALPADNRVFFSLPPVVEGKVALLAQSPYLRLALSPEIMRGEWATRILEPTRLSEEVAASQDADVLCIESGFLQSADARRLLSRYLTNGKGVFLIMNRTTPAVDGALRELGFEAEGTISPGVSNAEKFQFVLSNHPIFHPFLSPDYGNLMEIRVSQYVRLKAKDASPLLFGEEGQALFFQASRLKGKLFVCAFGLDRDHTSWPIHQSFIPFLDLTLQSARAEDPMPTSFEPGDIASLQFPGVGPSHEVVLREEGREAARASVEQGRARLRLPARPGLYAMTFDEDDKIQKLVSVNPSPRESELVYVNSPERVAAWRMKSFPDKAADVGPRPPARIHLPSVLRQQVWWWMVLGGLLVLLVESCWTSAKTEGA